MGLVERVEWVSLIVGVASLVRLDKSMLTPPPLVVVASLRIENNPFGKGQLRN